MKKYQQLIRYYAPAFEIGGACHPSPPIWHASVIISQSQSQSVSLHCPPNRLQPVLHHLSSVIRLTRGHLVSHLVAAAGTCSSANYR